ncbi:MAG: diaminopimelate epimerase [Firmicutes bacterium]|nr:diaminopimelate epimerase [Bacillota bacterium]
MKLVKLKFVKIHGLGNDFVLLPDGDPGLGELSKLAVKLCHRRFGIGADGLVLLSPRETGGWAMRIFNADGTEAEMCGNALRSVARYLVESGREKGPEVAIGTRAGVKPATILPEGEVRVDMGAPILESSSIPVAGEPRRVINEELEVAGKKFRFTAVSMGNPHCVIFLETDREVEVPYWGPLIERHPLFPQGVNVEFCRVDSPGEVQVKVWERGAGETLACGTGACATLVAGVLQGKLDRRAKVKLPGGVLNISWPPGGAVLMEGPAEEVFTGEVTLKVKGGFLDDV